MNYPFRKKQSRIVALLLAMVLMVGMLAGCKKSDPEPSTEDTQPVTPPGLVEVKPTETEEVTEPTDATVPLDGNYGIVKEQVNVRSSPSTESNVIGHLDAGTQVEILRQEELLGIKWGLIREGWIAMEFVEMGATAVDPNETDTPAGTEPDNKDDEKDTNTTSIKGVINADGLNIRKEPSTNAQVVGSYNKSTVVTILEVKNGWGRTNKGWVSMKYVTTNGNGTENNTTNNKDNDKNDNTTNANATMGVVIASELNIRSEASTTGERKGAYKYGDRISILETSNGWGRTDKGWISMQYVYQDGTTGNNSCKGVVIGTQLNVRSGPGTNYGGVGSMNYGDRVTILQVIDYGNTSWGCTKNGWISMDYIYVDGTVGEKSGTATILGDQLNIRSGPGTGYASVGSLNKGDSVKILTQITIGDTTWGCIEKGWISMEFAGMDE